MLDSEVKPFQDPHEFGDEGFQMENMFLSQD